MDDQMEKELVDAAMQVEQLRISLEDKAILTNTLQVMFYLRIKGIKTNEYQKVIDDWKFNGEAPWTKN